jgi:hypothetical protein
LAAWVASTTGTLGSASANQPSAGPATGCRP